jgi:hypothetical protein
LTLSKIEAQIGTPKPGEDSKLQLIKANKGLIQVKKSEVNREEGRLKEFRSRIEQRRKQNPDD